MSIFEMTTLSVAGIGPDGSVGAAAQTRANIMEATQATEAAVLTPNDAGAFPHELRAALAARMAQSGGELGLATRYMARAGESVALTDPAETGAAEGLEHIVSFVDKAANHTRDIAAEDIAALQAAGVADPDIVKLCELVAFMAYQLRVVAGLRLMKGAAA